MVKRRAARAAERFMMRTALLLRYAPALVLLLALAAPSPAQPGTRIPAPSYDIPLRIATAVTTDSISRDTFRSNHAFSLDNFLENVSGFVLGRQGAIGAPTRFSRFGMGLGRCVVLLDGVPMNDPENDIVPLVLIPTSDVGSLEFVKRGENWGGGTIEGVLRIRRPDVPLGKPEAIIELSKGTNDIKQRRVRFSSIRSSLGIDLAYDELLNDGYQYDANGLVTAADLGRFSSRVYSLRARGTLSETDGYSFSFKRYTSDYQGDRLDAGRELNRRGHLGVASARLGAVRLQAYEREFESTLPDSSSENQTVGASAAFDMSGTAGGTVTATAGLEDVVARQEIRGAVATPDLQCVRFGVTDRREWRGFEAEIDAGAKHQFGYATGWGGGVTLSRRLNTSHRARIAFERSYRLPNLGELFTPRHASAEFDTVRIAGNPGLGSEHAYEARAALESEARGLRNELSVHLIRVGDPVVPRSFDETGGVVRTLANGSAENAAVVMDRFSIAGALMGIRLNLGGGVVYSPGDKNYFLRSVPQTKVDASLSAGRMLFRPSSDMVFTAQFQHSASRSTGIGGMMPAYQVLNLKLEARLIDAHLYLMWLNITNEKYETDGPYLMTPRTFVYGVEWTIFN